MKIRLRIERFDPEKDEAPRFETFDVEAGPTERLLMILMRIRRTIDPTLAFRRSCAHGVCGSCAMVINGRERLACKTLVKDVAADHGEAVEIGPLRTLPVERDLMVDQDLFFEKYMKVSPFLINDEAPPEEERRQSREEHAKIEETTNCILCASCYSTCPVLKETNPGFIGPAASVAAARFNNDSRDHGFEERLLALDQPDGVWACENHFECTKVCPRGIKITKQINLTKGAIESSRSS